MEESPRDFRWRREKEGEEKNAADVGRASTEIASIFGLLSRDSGFAICNSKASEVLMQEVFLVTPNERYNPHYLDGWGMGIKSEKIPLVKDRASGESDASVGMVPTRWVPCLLTAETLHFSRAED